MTCHDEVKCFLMIISCLFDSFIVKAPVLHSTSAAPAQYVSNTEISDAQLRHDNSLTVTLSETSLQMGIFLDLVITVTTRAEVRATTTGTVEMTLRIRVLTGMAAAAVTTLRLLCPSLSRW